VSPFHKALWKGAYQNTDAKESPDDGATTPFRTSGQ
jgi:hypothetical protein